MISHYFPYLQNLSAVPLPAYGRVGRASLTFISRWTHFLGIVRATRDIVPVAPGVEVQLSPQRRPRQGGEPSLVIGGSIEQGVTATVPSPSQAQPIIPAAVQIGASHTQEGGPPQNLNATEETPAGTLPHVGLISSAAKVIVNITDPANNEIIMTSTFTNIDVPSDISTRLQVSSPRHLALTPLIQLPRDLNPTLQYWCHFYHTKDPGFLPMLDRLHDWFRYTVAATAYIRKITYSGRQRKASSTVVGIRQWAARINGELGNMMKNGKRCLELLPISPSLHRSATPQKPPQAHQKQKKGCCLS
ncbi:hypothetical protein L484_001954 [Morus notabilis]|uniref:Uncharacterized protein n=1 Tax=Morus notabilis TaxID=981085 RepID=W9RNK5_9ROSA|nr:hypothetical protein L484_001954 [Morus notabilis]